MNFKLLGFKFNFSRRSRFYISPNDVKFLNKKNEVLILGGCLENYFNKIKMISLNKIDQDLKKNAVERIIDDGIFVIPDFIDPTLTEELCKKIELEVDRYTRYLNRKQFFEDDRALIQKDSEKVQGYSGLAQYSKPVMDIRSGADQGMIDIFNVDRLVDPDSNDEVLNKILQDNFLKDFLLSLPQKLKVKNINAYVNSGVTSTRGFHADTYARKIKIFIYLTDVLEFKHGPYTYVKGTHKNSPYRRVNRYLSQDLVAKTEAPIVPHEEIYPILAPKGSLVVSDQAGFHRGFPQQADGKRVILTVNCTQG